jgi:hypothetical protein
MKLRHRIVLTCAALLFALFLIGESHHGQELLRGKLRPNETPFDADDRFMGAAFAPLVYCLVPGAILLIYGVGDILITRARRRVAS